MVEYDALGNRIYSIKKNLDIPNPDSMIPKNDSLMPKFTPIVIPKPEPEINYQQLSDLKHSLGTLRLNLGMAEMHAMQYGVSVANTVYVNRVREKILDLEDEVFDTLHPKKKKK